MILSEATRILAFSIFAELRDSTSTADRLGISGATTYLCNNYTSPLHCDDDASRGLCAQYDLQALPQYCKYSFIYADYGLYMVSRANSLWYNFCFIILLLSESVVTLGHLVEQRCMEQCFHLQFHYQKVIIWPQKFPEFPMEAITLLPSQTRQLLISIKWSGDIILTFTTTGGRM